MDKGSGTGRRAASLYFRGDDVTSGPGPRLLLWLPLDRALHAAGLKDEREVVTGRLEPNGEITLLRRAH